ncbi:hypothetical protein EX30DRAFT_67614 [Ascodesmis nigricans]|uniref:Uncharacterized protein n=1 Tax=Ascodesmis nigricans TaxID=341454 RepID=A0A4V3SIH0_9PEZI|nr:hypothetical protein EX30DRAFT_67614 [Ascodesmis nigricans]
MIWLCSDNAFSFCCLFFLLSAFMIRSALFNVQVMRCTPESGHKISGYNSPRSEALVVSSFVWLMTKLFFMHRLLLVCDGAYGSCSKIV